MGFCNNRTSSPWVSSGRRSQGLAPHGLTGFHLLAAWPLLPAQPIYNIMFIKHPGGRPRSSAGGYPGQICQMAVTGRAAAALKGYLLTKFLQIGGTLGPSLSDNPAQPLATDKKIRNMLIRLLNLFINKSGIILTHCLKD